MTVVDITVPIQARSTTDYDWAKERERWTPRSDGLIVHTAGFDEDAKVFCRIWTSGVVGAGGPFHSGTRPATGGPRR